MRDLEEVVSSKPGINDNLLPFAASTLDCHAPLTPSLTNVCVEAAGFSSNAASKIVALPGTVQERVGPTEGATPLRSVTALRPYPGSITLRKAY